jgi:hypothetical protein
LQRDGEQTGSAVGVAMQRHLVSSQTVPRAHAGTIEQRCSGRIDSLDSLEPLAHDASVSSAKASRRIMWRDRASAAPVQLERCQFMRCG